MYRLYMEENKSDIDLIILHYLQKTISDEEMRILMDWLKEKEENKTLFFQTKDVFELHSNGLYPTKEYIQESKERLFSKIRKTEEAKAEESSMSRKREARISFFKYMAIAVVAIGLTLGVQHLLTPEEIITYTELDIESGPRMGHITLPDGTKAFLNASTKLRFPDKFEKNSRVVYLDGEAFFDVISNEKAPFIVHSSKQRIRVLGTKFNVMDYTEDDYAITTLVSGKIDLATIDETGEATKTMELHPDQQVFYSRTNKHIALSNIKTDMNRIWVNKIYHFKNEPLKMITSRLEKLYGVKISILNETLKDTEFTGTFKLGQDLNEVLSIINFERLFTYERTENEIFIK